MGSNSPKLSAWNSVFNQIHKCIRPRSRCNAVNTRCGVIPGFTNACFMILKKFRRDSLINKGTMMGLMLYKRLIMGSKSPERTLL